MSELICPKCQGAMRTYERSGITVDQCTECRGIFLDRGELERLVDAEAAHHEQPAPRQREQEYRQPEYRQPEYRDQPYREQRDYGHGGYGHGGYGSHGHHGKKKKSLFEELFD